MMTKTKTKAKAKKKKKVYSAQEIAQRKKEQALRRKIRTTFCSAGFEHFKTDHIEHVIGFRKIEVDWVFLFENIMLVCEDTTTGEKHASEHLQNKNEVFTIINNNFPEYFKLLCEDFPEQIDSLKKYPLSRIKVFYVYISTNEISEETKCRYPLINFIEPHSLNYFNRMAQCIKRSARFEFFRFLGVGTKDIGFVKSGTQQMIETPIICPEDWTGLHNGEKVVSFMMSAESLLQTCYVLRKDNWDDSSQLYQRLIEKEKIRSIRSFLLKHGQAFYNNIIVALPSSVRFTDGTGYYTIDQIDPQKNYTMMVPDEINSICVIDGQHRIFSHYEGPESDKSEPRIRELRSKLHLLVTGIVFPDQMTSLQKSKAQSQIFLDINSNAKPVPADVLLHIEKLQNPFSDLGLARQVIERLNRRDVFLNKFELSSLDDSKIKVASIIKFALRYLVTMKPADGKVSLYTYWTGDKAALEAEKEDALKQYLDYLTTTLTCYFSAIRSVYKSEWENPDSKILSVTSLNGFIIAYTRQLPTNRVNGFEFYASRIPKLTVKFTKEDFPYASSQYRKFSDKILEDCFGISEDT